MAFSGEYKFHNFMGTFANDAACLTFVQANNWDSNGNGTGTPENGMWYYSTGTNDFRAYKNGAWADLAGGGGTPGGATGDIQYNDGAGGFAAEAALNWNAANDYLTLGAAARLITGAYGTPTDVTAGGVIINQGAAGGNALTAHYTGVAHPFSAIAQTDTFFQIWNGGAAGAAGGAYVEGFADANSPGLSLASFTESPDNILTGGVLQLRAAQHSIGGNPGVMGDAFDAIAMYNWLTPILKVRGNGDTHPYGALVTGGYTSTKDVDGGGATLFHGVGTGQVLTFKNSSINHLFTTYGDADTYAQFSKYNSAAGGLLLRTFTETDNESFVLRAMIGGDVTPTDYPIRLEGSKWDGATAGQALTATENLMVLSTFSTDVAYFLGDGSYYNKGRLSIGNAAFEAAPDCSLGGATFNQTFLDTDILTFKSSDVAHTLTSDAEADTYATFRKVSAANGGLRIRGYTDITTQPAMRVDGICPGDPPTTVFSSTPPAVFSGSKHNGSGGVTSVGNDEALLCLANNGSARFWLNGYGDAWVRGKLTTGQELAPDVGDGGICLENPTFAAEKMVSFKNASVAHPITDVAETDTFGFMEKAQVNYGGLAVVGISDLGTTSPGVTVRGYVASPGTTVYSNPGAVNVTGYKSNGGTGSTVVASGEALFSVANWTESSCRLWLDGNGRLYLGSPTSAYGTLALNEDSPEGFVCIQMHGSDGVAFSIKNTDVAHGVTDWAQTDTFFFIEKEFIDTGGALLTGFTDDATTGFPGIKLRGISGTEDSTTSTLAYGCIELEGASANGTTIQAVAADSNVLVVKNRTTASMIVKGDGDIYYDGADQGTYDEEDDVALVNAARYEISQEYVRIRPEDRKRLEELGIIKNGFISNKKMTALQLGAIGQMWNMLRGMAKMLNVDETKLLEMAKNYT